MEVGLGGMVHPPQTFSVGVSLRLQAFLLSGGLLKLPKR